MSALTQGSVERWTPIEPLPRVEVGKPRMLCAEALGWGAGTVVAVLVIDQWQEKPVKLFAYSVRRGTWSLESLWR